VRTASTAAAGRAGTMSHLSVVVWPPNKAFKLTKLAAAPGSARQGAAAWPRRRETGATASQLNASVRLTQGAYMGLLEGLRRLVTGGQGKTSAGYEQRVMRDAWHAVGESLGLAHTYEPVHGPFRDALFGVVTGWPVLVRYLVNYDIQKPETVITMLVSGCQPPPTQLFRDDVLRLYERGVGSQAIALSREMYDEFGGRGLGVGLSLSGHELRHSQLYAIDDAHALERLIRGMVEIAKGLAGAGSEARNH